MWGDAQIQKPKTFTRGNSEISPVTHYSSVSCPEITNLTERRVQRHSRRSRAQSHPNLRVLAAACRMPTERLPPPSAHPTA
eukprot:521793-Prymnesium_polylepis.1